MNSGIVGSGRARASHEPWPRVKLGEVCEVATDGDWIESRDQSDAGIRLVQTGNIGDGVFLRKDNHAHYISVETFDRLHCTEIFAGDILISRLPEPVGRSCIIPASNERMITAVDCTIVRVKKNILPSYFVLYTCSADYYWQISKSVSGATRPRISRKNLMEISIPLPPLSVQRSIVARLERELGAVEKVTKAFGELERAAEGEFKAELRETFESLGSGDEMVGRSVPGNVSSSGTNTATRSARDSRARCRCEQYCPSSPACESQAVRNMSESNCKASSPTLRQYPVPDRRNREPTEFALEGGCGAQGTARPTAIRRVKLGEVCEILDSQRKPITKKDRVVGEIPYYGATGIVDHVADWIFDERLVLLGEDGAKWGSGDNSAFIIEGRSWVNNHAHVLRPNAQLFDSFVVYYLNSADLSNFISGVTVPKLNQQRMCEIAIPLPPLPVQREIVARLDAARERKERLVSAAKRGREAAALWRKAILKEAFE